MIEVKKHGVILHKTDANFESGGVLNPAVISDGVVIHMFYRAVAANGLSSIGYCQLQSPFEVSFRLKTPLLTPEFEYERAGMEDPRIIRNNEGYLLTYTAYDGVNASGALVTTSDLIHFNKKGIIVPRVGYRQFKGMVSGQKDIRAGYIGHNAAYYEQQGTPSAVWDKNVVFFPDRINNQYYLLHRIKPGIQWVSVEDISMLHSEEFWDRYLQDFNRHILLDPEYPHESAYIGAGAPPVLTPHGWLLIYHGVSQGAEGYIYTACAALLDADNPATVIARLPYPLIIPTETWEQEGVIKNVVFPTGAIAIDETLYIYYGGADNCIGCASVQLPELVNELLTHKI